MTDKKKTSPLERAHYDTGQLASEDVFHRRPFAERVAEIIVNRPPGSPLVVAMVGEWGSGKSTTLGYVKECLSSKPCGIAEFNPWRYKGEDALLLELLRALVRAINAEYDALTRWQKVMNWFSGNLKPLTDVTKAGGNFFQPGMGSFAQGAIGLLSDKLRTKIEQVRLQARAHLERSQRRVIVLLDDIDRLEADDMLTLMRLIKLTGDLPNVTYVLAMDDDHVSRLIGQRLDCNQETGRSYLEKIVNVRLSLPRIPDYKMKSYTLSLLNEVLNETGSDVRNDDALRVLEIFDSLCAPLITTPRKAWSIVNAYRFALGLLPRDELNTGDLLIIESLRLLRPSLYETLFHIMPSVFEGQRFKRLAYDMKPNQNDSEDAKEKLREEILNTAGDLTEFEKVRLWTALGKLFPQFNGLRSDSSHANWMRDKRVCSAPYFWRYFAGVIQDDDVSDYVVYEWITSTEAADSSASKSALLTHLNSKYAHAFMSKLRLSAPTQKPDLIKLVVLILAESSKDLSKGNHDEMGTDFWNEAAAISAECVIALNARHEILDAACEVIRKASDLKWCFQFSEQLPEHCKTQRVKTKEGLIIQTARVEVELAKRVLFEFEKNPPKSPKWVMKMVWILWRNRNAVPLKIDVTRMVQRNPNLAIHFLAAGCDYSETFTNPNRAWKWKGPKSIQELSEVIDLDLLREVLAIQFPHPPDLSQETAIFDSWEKERETIEMIAWRFLNDSVHESISEDVNDN